jgi:PKD repeat protein
MRRVLTLIVILCVGLAGFGQQKKSAKARATSGYPAITNSQRTQVAHVISPASPGICPGGTVVLTGAPVVSGHSYQWTHNNVNIPGAGSISYTASLTGTYSLFAYTAADTVYFDTVTVVQRALPVPDFTSNPSGQCSNTPVVFTNTSTGAVSYSWNFGDPGFPGNTSAAINPTHTFTGLPGNGTQNFSVQLTATNSFGCQATSTSTVTTKQLPDANLLGTGSVTHQGLPYFTSCVSAATDFTFLNPSTTNNSSYLINWGDATPNFSSPTFNTNLVHNYSVGPHTIHYTVNGANGCVANATYYVFVGNNPAVGIGNPGNTNICTGSILTFPITGTASNPTGTSYTISFNSPNTVYTYTQADVPDSVTNLFLLSSCNTTSSDGVLSYSNSFSARIVAENPCGTSAGSIVPIYVSQKPTVSFSISPKDTVCLNTPVTVSSVISNNYVTGQNCMPGKAVWTITPATGWSLTGGSLGNDFGQSNPDLWFSGSATLGLSFSATGTYTIKLKTGNPKCGLDSFVRTICVNPNPIGSFTIDQSLGCAPFVVTTNNGSNTPICGENTYEWTTSYNPISGCVPATSDVSFFNATTATSAEPQFQFTNPGTYFISLVTRNSAEVCSAPVVTKTITIKGRPSATIATIPPVCEGQSISPSITTGCYVAAAAHSWGFPGGNPAAAVGTSPGAIVYPTAGNYTIYDTVTNECGATPVQLNFVVSEQPDFAVPAAQKNCPGAMVGPFSFTSNVANTIFTWTNSTPSIGLAASGGAATSISSFTATNSTSSPVTATITVKGTKGTCVTTKTFTITVWNKPAAPTAVSPITYCANAIASPLSATAGTSQHLVWYPGASLTAPTPVTTTPGNTIYQVSQVNDTTGCESNQTNITVTINASPVITSVTPANPISCGTATGSLSINGLIANTSYSISYTKNGGAPVVANMLSSGTGIITISNLTAGTYDNITATLTACTSLPSGPVTLSDPNPPDTPTAGATATTICSGQAINFSSGTTTPPTVSYSWSGPNSFSSSLQNPVLTNATVAASGTYSVTVTKAGCASAAATVNITVNQSPSIPTVSAPVICSGQTLNISASSTPAAVTYGWSGPGGFTDNSQNPSRPNATVSMSGSYTVTATLGTCISTASVTALVKLTPSITASATQPTSCGTATGSIVLTGLIAGTYTVSYEKNSAPITISQTIAGNTLTISNLTAGVYDHIRVTLDGCPSNEQGPFTLADPNPPAAPQPQSNGPVCSGNALQLSVISPVAGGSYSWTGPNGFSSPQPSAQVSAAATTAATGNYTVTVSVSGCSSLPATIAVVVNQTPALPTITNNSPVCSGNTLSLSANTTTSGAISYSWTGPGGFTSLLQNISIPSAALTDAGTYNVTATLGTCSSDRSSTVVVNGTPAISSVQPGNPTQCATATGSLTIHGLTVSTSYQYAYTFNGSPQTGNSNSDASGNLVLSGLSSGVYDLITVTLTGCTSAAAGPFSLADPNPPAQPSVTTGGPVCSGNTLQLNAVSLTPGVTYSWTGPNSFTSNLANPTVPNATMAAGGSYSVTATLNSCTSAAGTVVATVNQTPDIPTVSSPETCSSQSLSLTANSATPGVSYSWTGPNSFTSILQNPVLNPATIAASGTYTATATLGTCSASNTTIALVKPTPVISGTFTHPQACSTPTGSIALQTLAAGSYTVSYTFNTAPITLASQSPDGAGILTISNLAAGIYDNITVTLNGCTSSTVGPFTLADPNPPAPPVAGSNGPLCAGATLNLTATNIGGASYSWTGPSTFSSALQNPSLINAQPADGGTYSVTVTVNNCTSSAATVLVVVNPLPATPVITTPVSYCVDATPIALSATPNAGATINWYTVSSGGTANASAPGTCYFSSGKHVLFC